MLLLHASLLLLLSAAGGRESWSHSTDFMAGTSSAWPLAGALAIAAPATASQLLAPPTLTAAAAGQQQAAASVSSSGNLKVAATAVNSHANFNPAPLMVAGGKQINADGSIGLALSSREIEKQIVDKILGEGYDKRIRPAGSGPYNASRPGK